MTSWTCIEKNGTGIEKNGTGIEKNGTGVCAIEKNGTGIRNNVLGLAVSAGLIAMAGSNVMAEVRGFVAIDGSAATITLADAYSVFSGHSTLNQGYAVIGLSGIKSNCAVSLGNFINVAGNGTGKPNVAGNGTGSPNVAGNGTGSPDVAGNGTGSPDVAGNGTGVTERGSCQSW